MNFAPVNHGFHGDAGIQVTGLARVGSLLPVTGPALEPVSLDEMKLYLRLDGDAEDTLVGAMISAARLTVEATLNCALLEQVWRLRVLRWASAGAVIAPIRPLRRLVAVRSVDAAGAGTDLELAGFRVDAAVHAIIALDRTPDIPASGHVEIDVAVGYGALASEVPEPLRLAVRTLVANWFDNRGEAPAARGAPLLPDAVRALLAPFRSMRLA